MESPLGAALNKPTPEEQEDLDRVAELAKQIVSNAQLKVMVRNARSDLRPFVYGLLVQHITRFKPVQFDKAWAYE